mgnify:CR=1 FL=1
MKYIYYILSILFTLSLGSCKDDIPGSDNPNIGGITLTLTSGNMETRTNLTSTAATQNVETVYIALYKVNEDGVYDNATFVAARNFDWSNESSLTSYEKQTQIFKFEDLVSGEYVILAVGLDADSRTTYFTDLSDFENKLNSTNANTLANAKAIAANAASIATSELFAGWKTFTYEPDIENKVEVEMKRRVAGVLCYLKDIPSTITESDGTYIVTKVQLRLFTNQNLAIRLARKEKGENNIGLQEDFGETQLENSDILMSYNLKGFSSKDGFYEIPVTDNTRLPNTILMGAYMLPIEYSPDENNKSTLTLEVWGTNDNLASGASPEEVCIQSFPVLQNGLSSGNDAEKYSIYPNYIYHIGQKPDNNSTEGDYPESLAGEKITVTAKEWDNEEVNVEFPTVPVEVFMELWNAENTMQYETSKYIFDCIGTEAILKVQNSLLHTPWILTIVGDGVYIRSKDMVNGVYTYSKEYKCTDEEANSTDMIEIPVLITDYAVYNDYSTISLENDIRTTTLYMSAQDNSATFQPIEVKQYNAVNVQFEDKEINQKVCRGFSRFNWGTIRNSIGEVISNGVPHNWGYKIMGEHTIIGGIPSDYDGENNCIEAKNTADYAGSGTDRYLAFYGSNADHSDASLMYKSLKEMCVGEDNQINRGTYWYLPSFYEVEYFLNYAISNIDVLNIIEYKNKNTDKYWTSLPRYSQRAYAFFVKDGKVDYNWEANNDERTNTYYMRQACKINIK